MSISRELGFEWGPAITGWGKYLPRHTVTNTQLIEQYDLDTTDEWIVTRTGIAERGIADHKTSTADMGTAAAREALDKKRANLPASKVQEIIVATTTPDHITPASASSIQANLGADNAVAYDTNAACAGFLVCLRNAFTLAKAGMSDNILVIGTDKLSTITNYGDRNTSILFADGSGAVVIKNGRRPAKVVEFYIKSDPENIRSLFVPAGGSRQPITHSNLGNRLNTIRMEGEKVYKFAVRAMSESIDRVLQQANMPISEVGLVICHQANLRIIEDVAKRFKLYDRSERRLSPIVYTNIARHGNTSSGTIPIAITEAVEEGRLVEGMNFVLASFGAGFTYGAAVIEWTGASHHQPTLLDKITQRTASMTDKIRRNRVFQILSP